MANWQRQLKLKDIWPKVESGELTVHQLAAEIAKRLKKLIPMAVQTGDTELDDLRDEIADEFEAFAEDKDGDKDEFDCIMERLYDWGDTALDAKWPPKKVCWIEVM